MNAQHNNQHVFISKSLDELTLLPTFCKQHKHILHAYSFLCFEAVNFNVEMNHFDAVFFASPRSVQFFIQTENCMQKKIAVAGQTTKRFIESLGLQVDFCPKNSGNIIDCSISFARWVKQQGIGRVLFPISSISNMSYTKMLSANQFQCVCVYKTHIGQRFIPNCDTYIFTSPSNVLGFLKTNYFPRHATVVAWGESTQHCLREHIGEKSVFTLEESSEEAILSYLSGSKTND